MTPDADSDRKIVIRRTFQAPRDLVFSAWTDPKHIDVWWGPRGFTTTTQRIDVRPGGMWVYVMHGPDGTDYDNWIRWTVIDRPDRLEYEHGSRTDAPAHFTTSVEFSDRDGGTEVVMRSLFPSKEARDLVVEKYGAVEGGKQHLARLGEHVAALQAGMAEVRRLHRFTRRIAAPRDLVFRAWTDPAQLAQWWGPHGFANPVCEFAARPRGAIRIDMRGPDGVTYPMTGEVCEVKPPELLSFACAALNERGEAEFEVLNTVRFAVDGDGTRVTVDAEVTRFTAIGKHNLDGMDVGWTQSLERLDDLLVDPAAARDPGRDIVTTRLVKGHTPERVCAAWTAPAELARWWGPKGFSNAFHAFDLRPGGEWRFTMRAPNGAEFANHCVFRLIDPPRALVFDHVEPMHRFTVTATFYPWAGGTLVRFRMRFPDAAAAEQVRGFVVPCNEENMDRLEAVLGGRM